MCVPLLNNRSGAPSAGYDSSIEALIGLKAFGSRLRLRTSAVWLPFLSLSLPPGAMFRLLIT